MEISRANAKGGYIKILGDIPARFPFQPRIGSRPRSVTTIYGTLFAPPSASDLCFPIDSSLTYPWSDTVNKLGLISFLRERRKK